MLKINNCDVFLKLIDSNGSIDRTTSIIFLFEVYFILTVQI